MYSLLTIECAALLIESILYGLYVVTFSATLFLLRRRRQSKLLTAVTVAMFLLSTAHIALLGSSLLRHINYGLIGNSLEFRDPAFPEPSIQVVLECINCILGDSIISWRAWVLWNRSKLVFAIPAALLTCTFGSAIGLCHAVIVAPAAGTTFSSGPVHLWGAISIGLTFVTNVWAVVMIAIRFWKHHLEQTASRGTASETYVSHPTSIYRILLFLIESGALYCCTLIVVAGTFISHTSGVYIMLDLLAQFTGIYPTLIVVLVCLQMTHRDAMEKIQQSEPLPSIVFARNTRRGESTGFGVVSGAESIIVQVDLREPFPQEDGQGKADHLRR